MDFEKLVDMVWDVAENNPNGFTVNLSLEVPTKGFVVAYNETQDSFGRDGLKKCLRHSIDHKGFIGGWINQDKTLQFDSVVILNNLDQAIDFGRSENQKAIWYLDKGCEIIL